MQFYLLVLINKEVPLRLIKHNFKTDLAKHQQIEHIVPTSLEHNQIKTSNTNK